MSAMDAEQSVDLARIMKSIPVTPAELDQVAMLNSQVTAYSAAASFAGGTLVNIAIGWLLAENLSDAARNGLIIGCLSSGGIALGFFIAAWKSRSLKMSKWADILNSTEFD